MVGHLFQNYETIYVRSFPTYTCNHSCYTILRAFFCHVYLRSFLLYGYKRAYICAQQSLHIYALQTSMYKRHRIIPSAKNPFMYDGDER